MKAFLSALTFFAIFLLTAGPASADQVVKRVSCRDYFDLNNELAVLKNYSETGIRFQFQVVRDGCRPKMNEGSFNLRFNDGTADAYSPTRNGRNTEMFTAILSANSELTLSFLTTGKKVSGTFDYVVSVD